MSSIVPKSKRVQKLARTKLSDFSDDERLVIETTRAAFSASRLVVFGSRVKGNWAEDSDLDIGVPGFTHKNHGNMVKILGARLPIKLDVWPIENVINREHVVIL